MEVAARTRRFRLGAAIVIALALGLIIWLALRDNGGSSGQPSNVTAVSPGQIRTLAAAIGHPVFWVGPKEGYTYELTRQQNGTIIVRYLPHGVKVGVRKPYLSVATYRFPGAYGAIQAVAKRKDTTSVKIPGGGIGAIAKSYSNSVHVAYPGVDYQVEVYDPKPGIVTSLLARGQLIAVGGLKSGSALAKPTAVTLAGLKSLASSVGHPVYWLGPSTRSTYELTRTPNGKIIIRYLPRGTTAGARKAYPAVATYPFPGAFPAIQALAKQDNVVKIKLARGGIAVINKTYPKSIHLAYPGAAYQVEVFHPSPARVRDLVTSGQVSTIG